MANPSQANLRFPATRTKFPLGKVVAIPAALAALQESGEEPATLLTTTHNGGDWGQVNDHDWKENEFSLEHGFRLLSACTLKSGVKIWCITESDRSVTSLLLPEEY